MNEFDISVFVRFIPVFFKEAKVEWGLGDPTGENLTWRKLEKVPES